MDKVTVRPAKAQISLGIRQVWSESSLCAQWVAKDPSFLHADSKDSDPTGRMPKLISVFAGRTLILLVLSCRGSNDKRDQKLYLFKPVHKTLIFISKVQFISTFLSAFYFKLSWNQGNYKNKISRSDFHFYSDFGKIRVSKLVNRKLI